MESGKKDPRVHTTRLERERGRVAGVQRQRRQPGAISRIELHLQEQSRKRALEKLRELESLKAILDVLRSPTPFEVTPERERVFQNFREI